jgi:hypothetical protein
LHAAEAQLDPVRKFVLERSRELRLTLADLSRGTGYNITYFHQYMTRGAPKQLPEEVRGRLARFLDVPEAALRTPPAPGAADRSLPPHPNRAITTYVPAVSGVPPVPVFRDLDEIDVTNATEWTTASSGGVRFALWITRPRGCRLKAGDQIHVHRSQPPRVGDIAVALQGNRVAAIGELVTSDDKGITIQVAPDVEWRAPDAIIMKVVQIVLA